LATEADEFTSPGFIDKKNIIFIDTRVADYQSLIANIQPDTEVVILDPTKDGITQITESLLGKQYDSLHIVSHGSAGSLQLGSNYLNSGNLSQYESQLKQWKASLTEDADILLYGCDVAAEETGVGFVQQLSQMTGADVAASNDLTGNDSLGGDWDLEVKTGSIEAPLAFSQQVIEEFGSVLNTPVAGDVIINEFSQGNDNGKEWVEILVVKDKLNLQGVRLVDQNITGAGGLDLTLSGSGFSSLKAGTLIVLYNGGDPDTIIASDTTYSPTTGDYTLQISSQNSGGNFAVTRTNGWNNTNSSFSNTTNTDVPRLLNASDTDELHRFARTTTPNSGKASAYLKNTVLGAANSAYWSSDISSALATPGLANGSDNTNWINRLRNDAPVLKTAGNPSLPTIDKDILNAANNGILVADLIKDLTTDADYNTQGIAVTDLTGNGTWQYSLDGGSNWTNFGMVSNNSATVLTSATPMYTGTLGGTPNTQGWFQFGSTGGTQTVSGNTTQLVSTQAGSAGYSNYDTFLPIPLNTNFPVLDRTKGFTLSFNVKINSEDHSGDSNRAGFSVIVVTSDNTKAIELGFWENEIWAQTASPLFSHSTTERTTSFDTKSDKRYDLKIKDDTYQLFATDTLLFSGSLRDYTTFNHTGAGLPYDPYERTNFIFLGDNTSSAQADVNLGRVELQQNTKVRFVPTDDSNGTANIAFRSWDGTDSLASGTTGVNTSVNGGITSFSADVETASITVNDAPTFSIGGNQSVKMGAGQQTVTKWAYDFYPGVNESSQIASNYVVDVTNNPDVFSVAPTIDAAGKLTYTPVTSLPGSGIRSATATIAVKAKDSEGGISLEAKTFKITVTSGAINFVTTDKANNIAVPTTNPDTLMGTDGSDRIDGLAGNDTIYGGLGNDRIIGGDGDDILYGDLDLASIPDYASVNSFTFNDIIQGNAGNDTIYGGWGNDTLYGNDGDDTIWGGDGDDIIWGVAGNDTFVLTTTNSGTDTIQDFTSGDKFGCAGGLGYASLTFMQQGNDTLIKAGTLNLAVVKNMIATSLEGSSASFISI
jgi:Ca2+-binding RTX toxin-like protein